MSNVSKEMVDAVRMARWEEWERMAKQMPRGHHILSVELLRINHNETAVVLTVVHDNRLVQYELRGDAKGGNPRPVISRPHVPAACHEPEFEKLLPHLAAFITRETTDSGDGGPIADGVAIGYPPPKEPPQPGAIALGGSLLTTTFNLGEQAVGSTGPT
jgi:hypothetical protein